MNEHSSKETLESFLSSNAGWLEKQEAYLRLTSSFSLPKIAEVLSAVMDVDLHKSDHFDECEAYVAAVNDHDVTLLLSPAEVSYTTNYEIMIEPGQECFATGPSVDLSSKLVSWLSERASTLGQFTTP
ncbi:MAG: hypothetical protein V4710_10660 [Verrucomicrobiota bacterium]